MAVKKKSWTIEIPLVDTTVELSAIEIQGLDKTAIKLDLTRILHGRSTEAKFIISVKDGKATAEIRKLALLPFYIQRAMRKGISYVEDSFEIKGEEFHLRIKPFMITRKKVHRSLRNELRKKAREAINEFCASKKSEEIFGAVAYGRLQKELSLRMKKVYPLAFCEIRILETVRKKEK